MVFIYCLHVKNTTAHKRCLINQPEDQRTQFFPQKQINRIFIMTMYSLLYSCESYFLERVYFSSELRENFPTVNTCWHGIWDEG